jgi:hypothetical protein
MLKAAIALMLIATVASLFSGLFFLVKDEGRSNRLVTALTVRVVLAAITVGLIAWGFLVASWSRMRRGRTVHSTYTKKNSPIHTTSTKCQYQLAASKPNWCSALKCPFRMRISITNRMIVPMVTWAP